MLALKQFIHLLYSVSSADPSLENDYKEIRAILKADQCEFYERFIGTLL